MVKTITHRELRNRSSEVLRRVNAGETLQVTKHGEVVAVLVPPDEPLTVRLTPAAVRGGFSSLPRSKVKESVADALDQLRGEL